MSDSEIEAQANEVVRGVLGTMALEGASLGSEAVARLKQYMVEYIKLRELHGGSRCCDYEGKCCCGWDELTDTSGLE